MLNSLTRLNNNLPSFDIVNWGDVFLPNPVEIPITYPFSDVFVQQFENEVVVEVEVPRFKKEDIQITFKEGFLLVAGQRKRDNNNEIKLSEKIWIGHGIDETKASARLTDGVLYVTLPRTEKAKGKQIFISE